MFLKISNLVLKSSESVRLSAFHLGSYAEVALLVLKVIELGSWFNFA